MVDLILIVSLVLATILGPELGEPAAAENEGDSVRVIATATSGLSGEVRSVVVTAGRPVDLGLEWRGEAVGEVRYRWLPAGSGRRELALGRRVLDGAPRAPEVSGAWRLHLEGEGWEETLEAPIVFVPVPLAERSGAHINGYRLGVWPAERSGRNGRYSPPVHLVEVTEETRHLPLSTHLRLGDFVTNDQRDVWPKYVVLDLRLIDKLELVVAELRRMGVRADRLHVMSGFRTPYYNEPHGSGRALYSRHTYGDAADVWIDNTGEGRMSDLNGDGRVDLFDARVMARAVDRVEARHPHLTGGLGVYVAPPGGSPWVHVDVRGAHSRW